MSKQVIYCDVDGCITDTIESIVKLYNEDFQYYKDFHEVKPWEVNTWWFEECNCSSKEQINTYFNTPRFFKNLKFMPWVEQVMSKLSKEYEIKFISMGYSPNLKGKEIYLADKFPNFEFIGVNYKENPDKSHIDMSDAIFIDDSAHNLETSNAKQKILFGDVYPWNEDWDGLRLANWKDVERYLLNFD